MGKKNIEWADEVWNPVTGCTKVSEGCRNCYAERMAKRLAGRFGYPAEEPFKVTLHENKLNEPVFWRKPKKIFVVSMGDLFHEDVPDELLWKVFCTMLGINSRHHIYMILTKRPKRMYKFVSEVALNFDYLYQTQKNIWIGVSVEDQKTADERIPWLMKTSVAVKFISCEPLLGLLKLNNWLNNDPRYGRFSCDGNRYLMPPSLNWVIVGGETGLGARVMHPDWVKSIRDECQSALIPFFFKGWGGKYPGAEGRILEGRTWDEYPMSQTGGIAANMID